MTLCPFQSGRQMIENKEAQKVATAVFIQNLTVFKKALKITFVWKFVLKT